MFASDGVAVTICDGRLQGDTFDRNQVGLFGLWMPGPGYFQMAGGSILAGNSTDMPSSLLPSPALQLEDTLFESNITGGNIIGGYWPGDPDDNDYWENWGPSMFIGTRDGNVDILAGVIYKPLSVNVNIYGASFVGNWDLYPKSVINVYGYDLKLSEDNEMSCPQYFPTFEPDTTTCKVLTGYLCDDSPINVKVRFISREDRPPNYIGFDVKGEVNLFNNVKCKKVVPEIDGCGSKKSAKSGKQNTHDNSAKSGKQNTHGSEEAFSLRF